MAKSIKVEEKKTKAVKPIIKENKKLTVNPKPAIKTTAVKKAPVAKPVAVKKVVPAPKPVAVAVKKAPVAKPVAVKKVVPAPKPVAVTSKKALVTKPVAVKKVVPAPKPVTVASEKAPVKKPVAVKKAVPAPKLVIVASKKAPIKKPLAVKKTVPAPKPVAVASKKAPVTKPVAVKKAVPSPKSITAKKVPVKNLIAIKKATITKPVAVKKAVPSPKSITAKKVPVKNPIAIKKATIKKPVAIKKVVPTPKQVAVASKKSPVAKPVAVKKVIPAPKKVIEDKSKYILSTSNKTASKEIKSAIKKAPLKKVAKNPALEAAKTAIIKPKVIKTADQMEQDMKKAAAKIENMAAEKVEIKPVSKLTEVIAKKIIDNKNESKKVNGSKVKDEKVKVENKTDKKESQIGKVKSEIQAQTKKSTTILEDKNKTEVTNEQVKPKVRYSDEDLEMFERVIIEAKREALDELRMLKDRLEDLNSYDLAEESMIYSMHMGEQGSEPMEKEKTYAQITRINEYVKKLDEALGRIKEKSYGICRVCEILIAKERLLAVPITTLSASWKIHQKCPDDNIDRIEAIN